VLELLKFINAQTAKDVYTISYQNLQDGLEIAMVVPHAMQSLHARIAMHLPRIW
jgi:hypothetical protein